MGFIKNLKKYITAALAPEMDERKNPECYTLGFQWLLTGHCNYNCRGCSVFAPLSGPLFADLETTVRDMNRISELMNRGRKVKKIALLGGEPLLHPQIADFFAPCRKAFPTAEIRIVTNGLLLTKMPETFWMQMATNNITLAPTYYGNGVDWDAAREKCAALAIAFKWHYCETDEDGKPRAPRHFAKFSLDLEGKQPPLANVRDCWRATAGFYTVGSGKAACCSVVPTIKYFSDFFGLDLKTCPEDFVDLFAVKTGGELLRSLKKPIHFCRYCKTRKWAVSVPYDRSARDISEWVDVLSKLC
jgi:pyruvate-formate lyase-activating enzyme